jgi:membrane protein
MTGSGVVQRVAAGFMRARRRLGWLDHVVRAGTRYDQADGGRLAAAVTYYAFFAAFSLVLVGFAILGYVLDNPAVLRSVQSFLSQNLPRVDAQALRDVRGTTGLVALVVLLVAGLFWVDALRSSIRAIWQLEEYPGNFFLRQLIDLAILAGLGLLLATSLAAAVSTETLLSWLLIDTAGVDGPPSRWLLASAGFALGIGFNTLLSIAVLTGLPRLRMRLRRVLGPALLVAAGLEVLNTAGRLYVQRTEANPAYRVVAVAVGALVFLNLLNQLILFAAALTATSTVGSVTDLAAARTPSLPPPVPPAGANGRRCLTWRRMPAQRKARGAGGAHPPRRWR